MNTQPTPETNKISQWSDHHGWIVDIDFARKLERERDEAREQANDMREKWLAKGQCCEYLGAELHEAIKQRDRLAEAVNAATILIAAKGRHNTMLAYEGLREALQSLTPNADRIHGGAGQSKPSETTTPLDGASC